MEIVICSSGSIGFRRLHTSGLCVVRDDSLEELDLTHAGSRLNTLLWKLDDLWDETYDSHPSAMSDVVIRLGWVNFNDNSFDDQCYLFVHRDERRLSFLEVDSNWATNYFGESIYPPRRRG